MSQMPQTGHPAYQNKPQANLHSTCDKLPPLTSKALFAAVSWTFYPKKACDKRSAHVFWYKLSADLPLDHASS